MLDTRLGDARLALYLPDRAFPSDTLLTLSGDVTLAEPTFRSGLTLHLARAWTTPLDQLTCAHVRVLVGQGRGLRWIGGHAAAFVARYPEAECDYFPGDLTMAALRSWRELLRIAPDETRAMLEADMDWLIQTALTEVPRGLATEAARALADAREFVEAGSSVVKP